LELLINCILNQEKGGDKGVNGDLWNYENNLINFEKLLQYLKCYFHIHIMSRSQKVIYKKKSNDKLEIN
jgi:hypothetical protein